MEFKIKYEPFTSNDFQEEGIDKNRFVIEAICCMLSAKGIINLTEEEYNKLDDFGKSHFIGE